MKRDQLEFRREYAKEKVENMGLLTSTRLEEDEFEDDDDMDFNKSVRAETGLRSLDSRREFLTKFLRTATERYSSICKNKRRGI